MIALSVMSMASLGNITSTAITSTEITSTEIQDILLAGYRTEQRPLEPFHEPDLVNIQVYLQELTDVSEQKMQLEVSMYLRAQWNDPRLSYEHLPEAAAKFPFMYLRPSQIWLPQIFISSSVQVSVNEEALYLFPNGDVWWSRETDTVLYCLMDFRFMPFDKHSCPLNIEPYSASSSTMALEWMEPAVEMKVQNNLWDLEHGNASATLHEYTVHGRKMPWSTLSVDLNLARYAHTGMDIVHLTVLFVFISYLGIWTGPAATR